MNTFIVQILFKGHFLNPIFQNRISPKYIFIVFGGGRGGKCLCLQHPAKTCKVVSEGISVSCDITKGWFPQVCVLACMFWKVKKKQMDFCCSPAGLKQSLKNSQNSVVALPLRSRLTLIKWLAAASFTLPVMWSIWVLPGCIPTTEKLLCCDLVRWTWAKVQHWHVLGTNICIYVHTYTHTHVYSTSTYTYTYMKYYTYVK